MNTTTDTRRRPQRRALTTAGFVALAAAAFATSVGAFMGGPPGQTQLPTTAQDFFQPGTQPSSDPQTFAEIVPSTEQWYLPSSVRAGRGCNGNTRLRAGAGVRPIRPIVGGRIGRVKADYG